MTDDLKTQYNDSDLTPSGAVRRSFVSDFHDTIADGSGVRRDYFKSLVMMHLAGHNVIIASGLHSDAQAELKSDPVVEGVLDELKLSPEERKDIDERLLNVLDKSGLIPQLKVRGVNGRPDVFCDDDPLQGRLGKVHLDPFEAEYEAFCQKGIVDPDRALEELINDPEALKKPWDIGPDEPDNDDFAEPDLSYGS